MSDRYLIEIRLIGEDLIPETVSSRDVGELLSSLEQMIASVVARDNPALGINESELIVGLASIQQGSYILQFRTPHEPEVEQAYGLVTRSIAKEAFNDLPIKAIDAIKTVRKITRKYRTSIEFWQGNGHFQQLATVTTNTRIDVEIPILRGPTTLYGTIIRVGGEEPPRVTLRLTSGDVVTCNITRREGLRVARQLGEKLYQTVGVRGQAHWDVHDMSLQYFLVEEVTPYTQNSINQALMSLHELAGEYYRSIDDIDAYVSDIRGHTEDI